MSDRTTVVGFNELAAVLRRLDKESESVTVDAMLNRLQVSPTDAMQVAMQRGLRMYLYDQGIPTTGAEDIQIPTKELASLSATWLDGFLTGLNLILIGLNLDHVPEGSHRIEGMR